MIFEWVLALMYLGASIHSGLVGQGWKSLYWVAAGVLTFAVIKGMK